jgi:hypothetical protein
MIPWAIAVILSRTNRLEWTSVASFAYWPKNDPEWDCSIERSFGVTRVGCSLCSYKSSAYEGNSHLIPSWAFPRRDETVKPRAREYSCSIAFGFPLRSCAVYQIYRVVPGKNVFLIFNNGLQFGSYLKNGWIPSLPLRPILPGLMVDTLAYGSVALIAVYMTRLAIARQRKRRGLCGKCGYDLRQNGGGTCPECGC